MTTSHYHNTIDVTISGMGGIINFEALAIKKLFSDMGYEVIVDNPHPHDARRQHPSVISESEDTFFERVKQLNHSTTIINIKVNHCPWGG